VIYLDGYEQLSDEFKGKIANETSALTAALNNEKASEILSID
jgi:hypothetical protein